MSSKKSKTAAEKDFEKRLYKLNLIGFASCDSEFLNSGSLLIRKKTGKYFCCQINRERLLLADSSVSSKNNVINFQILFFFKDQNKLLLEQEQEKINQKACKEIKKLILN